MLLTRCSPSTQTHWCHDFPPQVNNTSALAMTDDQVKELVANAAAGSKHMGRNHFLLVTMKRDYVCIFRF